MHNLIINNFDEQRNYDSTVNICKQCTNFKVARVGDVLHLCTYVLRRITYLAQG